MKKYSKEWRYLYDYKWQKYSKLFLSKNPLCIYCLQFFRTSPAEVTDHIIPHKGNVELFWDTSNHQPLCRACHDGPKKLEEERGVLPGYNENGMPFDSNHHWNKDK